MRALLVASLVAAPLAARAEASLRPAEVLPAPVSAPSGRVPLSQPIAPLPPGEPTWSLSLELATGLADPFFDKVALLGSIRRGLGPFALELFGGRAFAFAAPAFDVCTRASSCTSPTATQLRAAPGRFDWLGGFGAVLRGGIGKVSVAGLEAVRFTLEGGLDVTAVDWQVNDGHERSTLTAGGRALVAVGASVSRSLAARLELSDLVYPTTIRGSTGVEQQLLLGLALGWTPGTR